MRLRPLPLVLLAALAFSCSRCERGGGAARPRPELVKLLPKDADGILIVPDVARLGEKLRKLETLKISGLVAQLQGFRTGTELVDQVMQQVGVDIRSKEDLERAGFDPQRGLGMVLLRDRTAYSVIAVKDAGKLRQMLTTLARDRLGAGESATRDERGLSITTFSRAGTPVLAVAELDGFVVLAPAPVLATLPARARLAAGTTLADDARFTQALGRLPADRDFIAYAPQESAVAREWAMAGAVAVGQLAEDAVRLHADLPWHNTQSALQALVKAEGRSPYELLPADAFLVARYAGDPVALDPIWPHVAGMRIADSLRESGFDVKERILANLQPGAVFGVSLAPNASFAAGIPTLNVRRSNPFRFVNVVAAAEVKDPAKAAELLAALPAVAPKIGAQIQPAERDGRKVYLTQYSQGEGMHLALEGSRLLSAAPVARLDQALAQAKAGGTPSPGPLAEEPLRSAVEKQAFGVALDLAKLGAAVKALPSSAWGIGGFAIKGTTVRWLDAMSDLRAVTGSLSTRDGAIQAELTLRIVRE